MPFGVPLRLLLLLLLLLTGDGEHEGISNAIPFACIATRWRNRSDRQVLLLVFMNTPHPFPFVPSFSSFSCFSCFSLLPFLSSSCRICSASITATSCSDSPPPPPPTVSVSVSTYTSAVEGLTHLSRCARSSCRFMFPCCPCCPLFLSKAALTYLYQLI